MKSLVYIICLFSILSNSVNAQYVSIIGDAYYVNDKKQSEKKIIDLLRADLVPEAIDYIHDENLQALIYGGIAGALLITSGFAVRESLTYENTTLLGRTDEDQRRRFAIYAGVIGLGSGVMLYTCIKSRRAAKNKIRAGILKHNDTWQKKQRSDSREIGFGIQKHGLGITMSF